MNRRELLQSAGAVLVTPAVAALNAAGQKSDASPDDRAVWIGVMRRLADPVLTNLADGTLRPRMPVEQAAGADRRSVTHLEALGRLLGGHRAVDRAGADDTAEGRLRGRLRGSRAPRDRSRRRSRVAGLSELHARAPAARRRGVPRAGHCCARRGAARAARSARRRRTWSPRSSRRARSRRASTTGCCSRRRSKPALARARRRWDRDARRLRAPPARPVVQGRRRLRRRPAVPLGLLQQLRHSPDAARRARRVPGRVAGVEGAVARASRSARAATRRSRSGSSRPDGSFPAIGRSLAYRCGAFQLLAQMALRRALPEGVSPAQARGALTAVIRRTLEAPDTFDANGWLRIGFCGHQPGVGETYISTGSLYLCSVAFLPLGLPPTDEFWSARAAVDGEARLVGPAVPDRSRAWQRDRDVSVFCLSASVSVRSTLAGWLLAAVSGSSSSSSSWPCPSPPSGCCSSSAPSAASRRSPATRRSSCASAAT